MKNTVFFLLLVLCLAGSAQAYVLTLEAPSTIQAGVPLVVTGNTTFPVGTQFDLIVYKVQTTTPLEVNRKIIIVDETKQFQASFPTTGMEAGEYKVEARFLEDPGSKLGSDSVTLRIFTVVDRSNEIMITVSKDQVLGNALLIEGYIPKLGVSTITIKITGPQGAVVPPVDIRTTTRTGKDDGFFSKSIPVDEPGNYYVDFFDIKGFMATIKFMVVRPPPGTIVTVEETTAPATTIPPATSAPAPLAGGLAGIAVAAGLYRWIMQKR